MKIPEVKVHRDANGTTVDSPCHCFGSLTRTHSTAECPWLKFRTEFPAGRRVQLHPGTDQWMMGDRFGEVKKVDLKTFLVHVKMDVSKKTIKCKPEHILPKNPETDNRLEP